MAPVGREAPKSLRGAGSSSGSRAGNGTNISHTDRERARSIARSIRALPEAVGTTPVSESVVRSLSELLVCNAFAAYRPERDETASWRLGSRVDTRPDFFDAYDALLPSIAVPFAYDPLRPRVAHVNRVMVTSEIHTHGPEETCVIEDLWPVLGVGGHDQIRALVCEGSTLHAWIGGFREEPFTNRERALFTSLIPALKASLALRRRLLDADVATKGLASALEVLGSPTFVARAGGQVGHANRQGRDLLDRRPGDTRESIVDAIRRRPAEAYVASLLTAASPSWFLVVLRPKGVTAEGRMAEAVKRWRLTPRECDVLTCVLDGDSGKEIALKVNLHQGSVERHTTSILRKAKCDSRARLIATFWTKL